MDPQACLEQWRNALENGDREEERDAFIALRAWILKGGAELEWADQDERDHFVF